MLRGSCDDMQTVVGRLDVHTLGKAHRRTVTLITIGMHTTHAKRSFALAVIRRLEPVTRARGEKFRPGESIQLHLILRKNTAMHTNVVLRCALYRADSPDPPPV